MKNLVLLGSFKKDLKRIARRGHDRRKLDEIVTALRLEEPLPMRTRPHKLSGDWGGFWECHIEPNWLLIYKFTEKEVFLARTGTHADLFE